MKPYQGPLLAATISILPGDEITVEQLETPAGAQAAELLQGPQEALLRLLVRRNRGRFQEGKRYRVEVERTGRGSRIRVQPLSEP